MLNSNVRILLFLTSYFPLFVIIMIRHHQQVEVFYVLVPTIILTTAAMFKVFSSLNKTGGQYIDSQARFENTGKHTLQYFLTYVIPFVVTEITKWEELATYGIIFFVIGALYIKSDLIYLNPTLLLLRYNIYKVITKEKEMVIITKHSNNNIINPIVEIASGVYFERNQHTRSDNFNS